MNAKIKTVTITKDTYDDLIALSKHALSKITVEEYDIEYLLRCMAVANMVEAVFESGSFASFSREEFNLLMGVIDESTDE